MSFKFFCMDVRPLCANVTESMKNNHIKNGGKVIHYNDLSDVQKNYVQKVYISNFTTDILFNETYIQPFFFSVKEEFMQKCQNPDTVEIYELMNKYNMNEYIHSETGPAIIVTIQDQKFYYMNGKQLDEEVVKKMEHSKDFMDKFGKMIE